MGNQFVREPGRDGMGARNHKKYVRGEEIVFQAGKYFAMGDHRDHSLDSRYWGFVDRDGDHGQALFDYWSVEATARIMGRAVSAAAEKCS